MPYHAGSEQVNGTPRPNDNVPSNLSGLSAGHYTTDIPVAGAPKMPHLSETAPDEELDLVVAGFGPAGLAIAIAMQDAIEAEGGKKLHGLERRPKVAFLEKQDDFAWHSGMLLDGARMQISFIKDMATMRNPRSRFTFLNYLHQNKRIVQFSNLNTFLPARVEFEDYLRWCANQFRDVVSYGQQVVGVTPETTKSGSDAVQRFTVRSRNVHTGAETTVRARNVVIAIGGSPRIPQLFSSLTPRSPRIIHSSQYSNVIRDILPNRTDKYRVAIIGGGQSAAEIFDNLHKQYANCQTHLIIRGGALRPSDDSPFVNEVFDPERIDQFFAEPADVRSRILTGNKATNYSVVRLELLERVYETMYMQRLRYESEEQWPHRIFTYANIKNLGSRPDESVYMGLDWSSPGTVSEARHEIYDYDAIVLATGYTHDGHEAILEPIARATNKKNSNWNTTKDYQIQLDGLRVGSNSGIWLQGCNEETHGLSDTLLSALAVRGGQVVKSIFGDYNPAHNGDGAQVAYA